MWCLWRLTLLFLYTSMWSKRMDNVQAVISRVWSPQLYLQKATTNSFFMSCTQKCFAVWCLARLIWSTQAGMKHPSRYQHIIITFPSNLDAVIPDHLCLQTENLWNCRGCFSILPSCSGKQNLFSGLGRQSTAWDLAEDPFASSWSPLTAFNLLNLYSFHAKHQEGSFRSVSTAGEKTQPRAAQLFTWSERLHCLALQEKEYSLNRLTSTMSFSIKPISVLTTPVTRGILEGYTRGNTRGIGCAQTAMLEGSGAMARHSSPVPWPWSHYTSWALSHSPGGDLPDHHQNTPVDTQDHS